MIIITACNSQKRQGVLLRACVCLRERPPCDSGLVELVLTELKSKFDYNL